MPDQYPIAVAATDPANLSAARQLAVQLNLPFIPDIAATDTSAYSYLLVVTPDYLGLQDTRSKKYQPFYIDFSTGKLQHRSKLAGRRTELIAKAMGCKPRDNPIIIDTTAGLGRDSFILASMGFRIIMLEKSPIIHALLSNALSRAAAVPALANIIERMTLIQTDAVQWLPDNAMHTHPDIIYLDPMFPARQKSAQVKKEMVLLQRLLPSEQDNASLFKQALACAAKRVVVKRPRLANNIADQAPSYCIMGKSSRFDIYVV